MQYAQNFDRVLAQAIEDHIAAMGSTAELTRRLARDQGIALGRNEKARAAALKGIDKA